MNIAVIGSGISGMTAAHLLSRSHTVTLFEANTYIGGHTNTIDVQDNGRTLAVDTGFIVFNDWTYPNFIKLMEQLDVDAQDTQMSFGVQSETTGLEYCGSSINALFAQRRNLANLAFYRMLLDIVRFNRNMKRGRLQLDNQVSLGQYLNHNGYSRDFVDHYIIPMGAAIWSATHAAMLEFPLRFFCDFFDNHGLFNIVNQPQWRVIKGGSREYIAPMIAPFRKRVHLNRPVKAVRRTASAVELHFADGTSETFDGVVLACHSDQALVMLQDATDEERDTLGAIEYQENLAVLHTDTSLLPSSHRAWAAWNYHVSPKQALPRLTYNMNILQGLTSENTYCVTLNHDASIDPDRIIRKIQYAHPVFSAGAVEAKKQQARINGIQRTWFCGAYWGNGFHEDGVNSALAVTEQFGIDL